MRGEERRVVAEQAALRRVATLVAGGATPEKGFAAVVEEVGRLFAVDFADMGRYEPGGTISFVAAWGAVGDSSPVGTRWVLEGNNLGTVVFETGRPARLDSYADASGPLGVGGRKRGFRSAVGTPIVVEGSLWGVVIAGSTGAQRMPPDTEARLAEFTELLAMAIANAESRASLAKLAEEQAALRRVATLVARGTPPEQLFAAVVEEVAQLLPADLAGMGRYEPDGAVTLVASWSEAVEFAPVGSRWIPEEKNLGTLVFETGRPVRVDSFADDWGAVAVATRKLGVCSGVGAPIIVEGRLWGVMAAGSTLEQPMPPDTEARLADFTALLATAIANAESGASLATLAEEQAALRRVATLVARGTPPEEVFTAVAEEVGRLLRVEYTLLGRYEPDGTINFVAAWGRAGPVFPIGTTWPLGGKNLATIVAQTGRPALIDSWAERAGPLGDALRERGVTWSVGTPIMVEGRLWGLMAAGEIVGQHRPPDTEGRLKQFTELLGTAIANAESRAALTASRARVVAAADEARRRIERDLHDRAQQRLVALGLELRAAQAAAAGQGSALQDAFSSAAEGLATVFDELREISHGIHPAILSERGLGPALRALARRSALPVELDLGPERPLPEHVEVATYYVTSEALTNAAKHAHASVVHVELKVCDTTLRLVICDDGIGGADPGHGSGLLGLSDRIAALGGTLQLTSPAGDGTTLSIEIPLEGESSARFAEP